MRFVPFVWYSIFKLIGSNRVSEAPEKWYQSLQCLSGMISAFSSSILILKSASSSVCSSYYVISSKHYLLSKVLSASWLHRRRNGHYLPAIGGSDASVLVAASFPRRSGPDRSRNDRLSSGAVGFCWDSLFSDWKALVDKDSTHLELATAILRELHDQQPLLQRLYHHWRGLRGENRGRR